MGNHFAWSAGSKGTFWLKFFATTPRSERRIVETNLAKEAEWMPCHEIFQEEQPDNSGIVVKLDHIGYHFQVKESDHSKFELVDQFNWATAERLPVKTIEVWCEKSNQTGLRAWCATTEKPRMPEKEFSNDGLGIITLLDDVFTALPAKDAARISKHPDAAGVLGGQAPSREFSVTQFGETADQFAQMYVLGSSYSDVLRE